MGWAKRMMKNMYKAKRIMLSATARSRRAATKKVIIDKTKSMYAKARRARLQLKKGKSSNG
jgi:hypothetical protein